MSNSLISYPSRGCRAIFLGFIFNLFISLFLAVPAHCENLSDEELLETIQRQSFNYFIQERNPENGLVRDHANNFQKGASSAPASIAASGFALTAYAVGVERGWMDRGSAQELTRRTLQFFLNQAPQEHGFFFHFLDMTTGKRSGRSEVSPIDTALFLVGALFAAEYYEDPAIRDLAMKIYERVDWTWLLHDGKTLALSWSPEGGFNKLRWDHYDESMIMYLLAIGSPAHAIPADSWKAILRPVGSYGHYHVIQMPPLFTHQYSHIWIDFRDKNDGFADYFKNSVNASLANRAFVIDQSTKYSSYGPDSWGLTASNSPAGYQAFGAPPGWAKHNGTIAPTGCGSSIVFTPKESIACLRHFYEDLKDDLWGMYGFSDAFNLDKKWFDREVIAIDQGALLLMIENYRTGRIWEVMGRSESLKLAMDAVGFKPGTKDVPWPDPPKYQAPYVFGGMQIDGYLKDWPNGETIKLNAENRESGSLKDDKDLSGEFRFAWDENALYFSGNVTDDNLVLTHNGKNIWQDDLIEIYIDPAGDGLFWNDRKDFQIGFRPEREGGGVQIWSWFQGGEDWSNHGRTTARCFIDEFGGYLIEGAIAWNDLGIHPESGKVIRISPALHDADKDRSSAKLQWFFRNEEKLERFVLGEVILGAKGNVVQDEDAAAGKGPQP